jgi:stearoyl-CoA desaturase (Delta-9 desaturase)
MNEAEMAPRARQSWFRTSAAIFNLAGNLAIHGATVWAFWRGPTVKLVALAVALYLVRMFAITGAYHRYFSHRSFKTSRGFQFLLALLGTTATQKGPLWWASAHRLHHKYSDTERDLHSPKQRGFWYSHMGWWLSGAHEEARYEHIQDFAKYPELRFLDRWHWIGVFGLMAATGAFGFDAYLWGYVVSTCFLAHGTFTINSLAHVFGSRRYETSDTSRNNGLLALITLGEGWHNNHHHYQSSARQGFYWWELDITYYTLKALSWVGLVWDIREPPQRVLDEGRRPASGRKPALEPALQPAPTGVIGAVAALTTLDSVGAMGAMTTSELGAPDAVETLPTPAV